MYYIVYNIPYYQRQERMRSAFTQPSSLKRAMAQTMAGNRVCVCFVFGVNYVCKLSDKQIRGIAFHAKYTIYVHMWKMVAYSIMHGQQQRARERECVGEWGSGEAEASQVLQDN